MNRSSARPGSTTSLRFPRLDLPGDGLNRLVGGLLVAGSVTSYLFLPDAPIPWELGLASWVVWNLGLARGLITLMALVFLRWGMTTFVLPSPWDLSSSISELVAGALCGVWLDSRRRGWKRARRSARRDFLTQIPNRPAFLEALSEEAGRARQLGHSFAVAWLDCDGFKQLNDTRGHAAGDAALVLVGQLLSEAMRDRDLVGRLGGDEFAILLVQIDRENAQQMLDNVLNVIHEGLRVFYPELSISVGAVLSDENISDVAELLNQADKALYRAKALGGARTVWVEAVSPAPVVPVS